MIFEFHECSWGLPALDKPYVKRAVKSHNPNNHGFLGPKTWSVPASTSTKTSQLSQLE